MKILFFVLWCTLFAPGSFEDRKDVETSITNVTIYPLGATVTREGATELDAGITELRYSNLARSINRETIGFRADKELTILSVTHRDDHLAKGIKSKELLQLEERLKEADQKLSNAFVVLFTLEEDVKFLQANRDLSNRGLTVTKSTLDQMAEHYSQKMGALKANEMNQSKIVNNLKIERDSIAKQIDRINKQNQQPFGEIVVKVQSPKKAVYKTELSYYTHNAGWYPTYDLRVDDIQQPLEIFSNASVSQNSGELWEDIPLVLSSATPHFTNEIPILLPNYLRFRTEPTQSLRKNTDMLYQVANSPAITAAMNPATMQERETAIEYQINGLSTIKSDGQSQIVLLTKSKIPATYYHYSIPKLNNDVFLTAEVTDIDRVGLLNGEANIYLKGDFVGKTNISQDNLSDTLLFTLGRDRGIQIERTQLTNYTSKKIIGNRYEEESEWEIRVRNNKSVPVTITIVDQIPISTMENIVVNLKKLSGGSYNSATGEVKWSIKLDAGKNISLNLGYTIKYPADKILAR